MATTIKKARGPRLDTIEAIEYQLTVCARELRLSPPKSAKLARRKILKHADELLDAWLRMKGRM